MEPRCLNGHTVTIGANFCPTCGAGVVASPPIEPTMPIPVVAPPTPLPYVQQPPATPPLIPEPTAPPAAGQTSKPAGSRTPLLVAIESHWV